MQPQLILFSLISLTFTSVFAVPVPHLPVIEGRDLVTNIITAAPAAPILKRLPENSWLERTLSSMAEERCGDVIAGKRCA